MHIPQPAPVFNTWSADGGLKYSAFIRCTRIAQLKNECRTDWTPQGKIIDNGCVDNPGKYLLRPRLSWTGLYGKEPRPRERVRWERI